MKARRIALIVPTIGGGGAEKVAADLSLYFTNKGYEVYFFVREISKITNYSHSGKTLLIPMTYCDEKGSIIKSFYLLYKEAKQLKEIKGKYKIDISISFMQDCNLINILSKNRDKIYVTLHSVVSKRKESFGSISCNKWVFKYLYQLADKIVFVSKYCQKDWIRNYRDIFHKSCVIYNPIGYPRRSKGKSSIYYGSQIVITTARLEGIKRPWHIIRMFSRVLEICPNAHLLMLGEGSLMPSMKKLAKQMNLEDNIHFLGYIKNVEDYLMIAKVFILSSASESFSCSIAEAMKCGVPIVANDCPGGIREVLHVKNDLQCKNHIVKTKCGILTPFLDGRKYTAIDKLSKEEIIMAESVAKILLDHKLYEEFSGNCIKNARRFDLENIGLMWENIILG